MLIDTHVHFDGLIDKSPVGAILERASAQGVDRMIAVGGSARANTIALQIARENPGQVRAALGFDRSQAGIDPAVDDFEKMLSASEVAAVGETGLDYQPGQPARDRQISLFRLMLGLARQHSLPVIVHNRDADADVVEILTGHAELWPGPRERIGVCHCFTGSKDTALALVGLGFSLSFSGILTFEQRRADKPGRNRGRDLMEVAKMVPNERILVETDSPFLAPVPLRGRPNEPANVRYVARALAEIRGCEFEALAAETTRNAENIFFK